ncbi:hypothetical protein XENTR_v10000784 [Xenopus tropicalis]|uniref:NADH dehydrogenase [ubiquinone] 1 subunit C1, mitochondrial n=2 Tax=Xenopus tropicalis TaxID=8364 RepID=A0A6I8PY53_XENTR|nr:hypothetical protein XENTR_v10000784 [Xenopus tropicalis]
MLLSRVAGTLRLPLAVCRRSMYTASKPDTSRPNWLRVGLALGSTVAIWALLFTQHNDDVAEYKKRNGLQ